MPQPSLPTKTSPFPFPFPLRPELLARLPPPDSSGLRCVDVLVHGKWEGILVVDAAGNVIGVRADRRVVEEPLPFAPGDILEVRPACAWHLLLSAIPAGAFFWPSLVSLLVLSPACCAAVRRLSVYFLIPALLVGLGGAWGIHSSTRGPGLPLLRSFAILAWLALCGTFLATR